MRRRTCLRTAGAGLAAVMAGCNLQRSDNGEDPTSTSTASPTPTEPERQGPGDMTRPGYMDLLPRRHLKGTENTPNANFLRLDWQWYLKHYDTPMRFGAASDEDWNLKVRDGNLFEKAPPKYRILHTPIGATIQMASVVADILPGFPNLGPEIVQQCGFEMTNNSGQEDSRARYLGPESATVKEVIGYVKPGVTFFIGVDVESLESALESNIQETNKNVPDTVFYQGAGIASDREFFISDAWKRSILCIETASEAPGSLGPAAGQVAGVGTTKSAFRLNSIQWCFTQFGSNFPVTAGQINNGRRKFVGTNYNLSPIRELDQNMYDSVLLGFSTSDGLSATAKAAISEVEGDVIDERVLLDVYGPEDGTVRTSRQSSVVSLSANWE